MASDASSLPRGTVTFLFTDIEGSTELLKQIGGQYATVLADQRRMLREIFTRCNGQEVDTQGDSFFISFSRASEAIEAAVEAQKALAEHYWPEGVNVRVRMGLHTGEPLAVEEGYIGMDVHRASRIAQVGHGGQVLLSETTTPLVRNELPDGVNLLDLGRHRLKDMRYPEHISQLVIEGLPFEFPPLKSLDAGLPPHNLPVQLTSFVGRKKELSEIITHLQDPSCRLLTLIGPGGSGKTRLAVQAATECLKTFPDRVWYVDLTTLTSADMVPQAVASVIGVYSEAELSIEDALENALFTRDILLVMDNCEHVLDSAAQLISFLLHRCPGLSVFATSREPLGVVGELIYMVPVMSLPGFDESLDSLVEKDATVLFQERAISANPQFKLSKDNADAVVHICHRVDGIPLAIELAAARTRAFSPQEISDRIEDRFQILVSGSRDAPSRQQTLQSSVDWSYELLNEEERSIFNRLSVFRGGFSLEGAEQICSGKKIKVTDVIEILSNLIDKSLVKPPQTSDGQTRYDLLETLRQYGSEQLERSGKSYSVQQQHVEYYVTLTEEVEKQLLGSEIVSGLDRLEVEIDNVLTAVKWALENGEGEVALKILVSIQRYIDLRSFLVKQVRDLLHTALDLTQSSHKSLQAKGYASAGRLAWIDRDLENAKKLSQKSLELAIDLNDRELSIRPLISLGAIGALRWDFDYALEMLENALNLAKEIGNKYFISHSLLYIAVCETLSKQLSLFEEALAFAQEVGDEFLTGLILTVMGDKLMSSGQLEIANDVLNRSLEVWRRLKDKFRQGVALQNLAFIACRHCQYEKAKDFYKESLDLNLDGGHTKGIAFAYSWLGWIEGMINSYELAKKSFGEGLRNYQKLNWEPGIAMNLALSADVARVYEDFERAEKYCQESLKIYRKFSARSSEFYVLALMARIDLHKGDYSRAWSSYQEALSYIQDGDREDVLDVLEGIAATAVEFDLPDFSTQLFAAADQQRAATGILVPLSNKDFFDKAMASAKAALGEEQFAKAWAKGRVLSLDEAISFVQLEIGKNSASNS